MSRATVAPGTPRQTVVTYWEGPVTWLERLSAASIVAAGHPLHIYSHDVAGLRRQGLPGTVIDAREGIGPNVMADLYRRRGVLAFYADYLRLSLIRDGKGVWSDLDCVFQRPLDPSSGEAGYLFGWLNRSRLNNAILSAPPNSELVARYWDAISTVPIRAPWATGHIRVKRSLELLIGKRIPVHPERLAIGPRALTYFVRQLGLEGHAQPRAVFYPLGDDDAHLLAEADDRAARARILPETVAVHAWRGKLWSIGRDAPPPAASWLGQRCRDLGL
ncbi:MULTISPECIES: hypothetical protein [unclassified Methylobacterium]|uniref:hypothetical protein n=1 Tax=unclassified Methylobacterium TaxID=2615210 RepID=UPI000ACC06AF|nr:MULTISPECIES: hypothetical protein [unclassified Methylobacterium]MCK2055522.1 hypothetical protein [Methylobacterium sp. 37f]